MSVFLVLEQTIGSLFARVKPVQPASSKNHPATDTSYLAIKQSGPQIFEEAKKNPICQEPPSDFGIRLMEREEVIFSLRPYRFVWYVVTRAAITVVGIPFIPLVFLFALVAVHRHHYWLTNKRVIWCHGIIGYQVRSVPLERITDVVISRTLPEILARMSSIDIHDMAGKTERDGCPQWIGVEDAPEIQKRILEQIREVNENTKRL